MKVELNDVSKGENGGNLPATSLVYESGAVTLVAVETAARPTVLALLATGRMAPDAGTLAVTFDDDPVAEPAGAGELARAEAEPAGAGELARLRAETAIVDAPDVSEPVGDLRLSSVVQEELMFAGRPSHRRATADVLDELGAGDYAKWELRNVPVALRLRVLAELAASRPDTRALVLTSPDRHGGDPRDWWAIAAGFARRGYAVLVIANQASVDDLRSESTAFEQGRQRELRRLAAERAAEQRASAELASAERAARGAHEEPSEKDNA